MKTKSVSISQSVIFAVPRMAWLWAGLAVCVALRAHGAPLSEREALAWLTAMGAVGAPDLTYLRSEQPGPLSFEQYGPYLETVWDQCRHYNCLSCRC